ncbi:early endosome antigen 1-like [Ostrinia nubilalis]|uniref:early endosome antigen 1-like n=1 Tax=Ostrinia nubilalis TaxID=29057 RepID=UPI00308244C5
MCANYEKQLVAEQAAADAARDRAHKRDTALKLATEELEGVRSLHDETVRAWHAERAAAASTLQALQAAVGEAQATLLERAASARDAESRALHAVTTLTVHRETLQKKLDSLERDNAYLIGQYTKKAAELQNEFIDLPDNVEELQELALRLREQMIVCAVGREEAARAEHELRAQLLEHTRLLHQHDAALAAARAEHSDARWEHTVTGATGAEHELLEHTRLLHQHDAALAAARAEHSDARWEHTVTGATGAEHELLEHTRLLHQHDAALAAARAEHSDARWEHTVTGATGAEHELLEHTRLLHQHDAALAAARAEHSDARWEHTVTGATGAEHELLEHTRLLHQHDAALAAARAEHSDARWEHTVTGATGAEHELLEHTRLLHQHDAALAAARAEHSDARWEHTVTGATGAEHELLEHTRLLHQHDAALAAARAEHSDARWDILAWLPWGVRTRRTHAPITRQDSERILLCFLLFSTDFKKRRRKELEQLQTERGQLSELGDKLRAANDLTEQLLDDKRRLAAEAAELRGRVGALQQELDNSEKVQQDFVRLSQSLQVQLQRIREADTEVRWQHDDDVSECPACRAPLPNNKKKVHCRHCGRIFCAACASHQVPAGPRRTPARVCSVCRTLLQPHTAPYFSTEPPHSPA